MQNGIGSGIARISSADGAASPFLFDANCTHPIDARFAHLREDRKRHLQRLSLQRAVDEARPYRFCFPLGAPEQD